MFKNAVVKVLTALCLLAFLCGVVPAQAYAYTIRIYNPYSQKLHVAFINYDDNAGTWHCHGWQNINPQDGKTVEVSNSTGAQYVYIYAFNSEASFSGEGYKDSIPRYVIDGVFDYYDGDSCPAGKNQRKVYFAKWEINNGLIDYSP